MQVNLFYTLWKLSIEMNANRKLLEKVRLQF